MSARDNESLRTYPYPATTTCFVQSAGSCPFHKYCSDMRSYSSILYQLPNALAEMLLSFTQHCAVLRIDFCQTMREHTTLRGLLPKPWLLGHQHTRCWYQPHQACSTLQYETFGNPKMTRDPSSMVLMTSSWTTRIRKFLDSFLRRKIAESPWLKRIKVNTISEGIRMICMMCSRILKVASDGKNFCRLYSDISGFRLSSPWMKVGYTISHVESMSDPVVMMFQASIKSALGNGPSLLPVVVHSKTKTTWL